MRLVVAVAPAFVWGAAISALPHKEERFLYPVYPLVRLRTSQFHPEMRVPPQCDRLHCASNIRFLPCMQLAHGRWLEGTGSMLRRSACARR